MVCDKVASPQLNLRTEEGRKATQTGVSVQTFIPLERPLSSHELTKGHVSGASNLRSLVGRAGHLTTGNAVAVRLK